MDSSNIESLLGAEKIGLFDSGLGGLSVLSSFIDSESSLNRKEFIYIGDTKRCPYGNRSYAEIREFVTQLGVWLVKEGADAIVMACNTSAALLAEEIKRTCPVKVVNLLEPTAAYVKEIGFRKVGVIATNTTARSKAFSKAIKGSSARTEVFELGCPDLVPIVESGQFESEAAVDALRPYAKTLLEHNVDSIIFGCTHYPFLREAMAANVRQLAPKRNVTLIDPARVLTRQLSLAGGPTDGAPRLDIATTGDAEDFADKTALLLGIDKSCLNVRNIPLSELTAQETGLSPVPVDVISPSPIP